MTDERPTLLETSIWRAEFPVWQGASRVESRSVTTPGDPDTAQKVLWKGFRGVGHLTAASSELGERVWTTWFTRANVLLEVTEAAPVSTRAAQTTQDNLRRAFILATLLKLDNAAS